MTIRIIDGNFSVVKLKDFKNIPLDKDFCFACKSDKEYSLAVKTCDAPNDYIQREDGWSAMYVDGALDFSLIGVLAKISGALANKGVAMFAVSTFDTDYILVKSENLQKSICALKEVGFEVY